MNPDILNPPAAHGLPLFNAVLKHRARDFRVDELMELEFSGTGEHLYLQLEKTSMNTDELTTLLQQAYAVTSADVGFCGLKDRHSVSTQWFSVRTPEAASVIEQLAITYNKQQREQWGDESGYLKAIQLVRSERHSRKLKRGAHKGNRFIITLRDVRPCGQATSESSAPSVVKQAPMAEALTTRIEAITSRGFPAYIGAQRFGHGGQNLQRARQWFKKSGKRTSRQQRSLWLSAARSALFNVVCAARVRDGSWLSLMEGEPAMLDGTGSYFIASNDNTIAGTEAPNTDHSVSSSKDAATSTDDAVANTDDVMAAMSASSAVSDASLAKRIASHDIHPSAPWWGRGRATSQGECADYEGGVLAPFADLCAGLERAGLPQERRALRAIAQAFTVEWLSDTVIELKFSLAPGIFATTLLGELGTCTEPDRNAG